jgi:hypothetical protein
MDDGRPVLPRTNVGLHKAHAMCDAQRATSVDSIDETGKVYDEYIYEGCDDFLYSVDMQRTRGRRKVSNNSDACGIVEQDRRLQEAMKKRKKK